MPNIVQEDLWALVDLPALYMVTTNSTVKANGASIMGRGAAKQLKFCVRGIDPLVETFLRNSQPKTIDNVTESTV